MIKPTDWEAKSKDIIAKLDNDLFNNIDEDELYDFKYSKDGDITSKAKRRLGRGEIMPTISGYRQTEPLSASLPPNDL